MENSDDFQHRKGLFNAYGVNQAAQRPSSVGKGGRIFQHSVAD